MFYCNTNLLLLGVQGPTKEEVMKKVDSMMEEYLSSSNTQEAISFYKEQKVPDRFVSEVLLTVMNKSLDKGGKV
jgi:translation initiation factor 4G